MLKRTRLKVAAQRLSDHQGHDLHSKCDLEPDQPLLPFTRTMKLSQKKTNPMNPVTKQYQPLLDHQGKQNLNFSSDYGAGFRRILEQNFSSSMSFKQLWWSSEIVVRLLDGLLKSYGIRRINHQVVVTAILL